MRQKVIIYSCSETCRLTICGTLHWVWNNSGNLISHHLKGDISLCYPVAPSHLDPSSVAIMCCFWSNTCITASLWDWAWIFHVCLTASTLFNLYVKTKVEIQCSPNGKWPWKFIQSFWILKDTAGDREQMLHFSRLSSVLAAHGWKIGQFAVYQSAVSLHSIH